MSLRPCALVAAFGLCHSGELTMVRRMWSSCWQCARWPVLMELPRVQTRAEEEAERRKGVDASLGECHARTSLPLGVADAPPARTLLHP